MEEVDTFGLIGVLLIGFFGMASMCFAATQIWSYLDRSPRWGRSTANVVTGLAVMLLLPLVWPLFDLFWVAKWVAAGARRRQQRPGSA